MVDKLKSVLIIGFNTRPLVYSLNEAGYEVYAVDFFGDLDLFPYVDDYIIVLKEVESDYHTMKYKYSKLLANFALKLHRNHREVDFILIGSGLDDAYEERDIILDEIESFNTISVNNDVQTIRKSRNIKYLFGLLKSKGYKVPSMHNFKFEKLKLEFPFILKKARSAGGTSVYKIENKMNLEYQLKILEQKDFKPSEWIIQEYIEGFPVSCTVISNGKDCQIISINRQIIGEEYLNAPKDYMYCGNIVPAELSEDEKKLIAEISKSLAEELGLKGINGFDFVLKGHYPYLMECNPRIPGSIRASETALDLDLLDLHIKSFLPNEWEKVKTLLKSRKVKTIATKFIFFAPKEIDKNLLLKINNLKFVHDKSEPNKNILKGEPLCTILYSANDFSSSFNGAKRIIDKINEIIE